MPPRARKPRRPPRATQRATTSRRRGRRRPPRGRCPRRATVPAPARRGGSLRVHLDAEPPNLMPLGDVEASAMQVTYGAGLRDAGRLQRRQLQPGAGRELGRLRRRHAGGGARPQRRALARQAGVRRDGRAGDHRAAAALGRRRRRAARAAGRRRVRRAGHRTDVRFALEAAVGSGAARAVRVPILPEHIIRGARPESPAIARQPIGTGPFRFAGWERGKRIRLERVADILGPGRRASTRSSSISTADAVRALNRTRRGEIDILTRVLDVHYPEQVEPTTLHGARRSIAWRSRRYSFLVVNQRALSAVRSSVSGARWPCCGIATDSRPSSTTIWRARSAGRRSAGDRPAPAFDRQRAIAALEEAGYRDTDADGVRDHQGKPIRLTMLEPAGQQAVQRRGARLRAGDAQGRVCSSTWSRPTRRRSCSASSRASSIWRR